MVDKILVYLKENGWSADNIAFGSGGTCISIVCYYTEPLCSRISLFFYLNYIFVLYIPLNFKEFHGMVLLIHILCSDRCLTAKD